ncbi:hypothetical protein BO94DRAFT_623345 [Aspergillus sclerotioniger CBS 115572]|uniref:CHAT domain-containing protein n=1 Tax=Aspergillus sclerotioniger CBS 115572 TaxID=1450535 RepID=A0A317WZA6_9EURO|nr:hypothetical protein BO94DRAFT_623345 [Aspergillus sclerotioniger CBS 115572]PWY90597.1 hypothetical protein BO94DRAFT_623345 [Aspergillus sclerotioniger CBS 115572]
MPAPPSWNRLSIDQAASQAYKLLEKNWTTRNIEGLNKVLSQYERLLPHAAVDSPGRCTLLYMIAMALTIRYEVTMASKDIENAVTYTQCALFWLPDEPVLQAGCARALIYRHQSTGFDPDLDHGIVDLEDAMTSPSWNRAQQCENASLLVTAYTLRDRGDDDFERAWSLMSKLIAGMPLDIDEPLTDGFPETEEEVAKLPQNHSLRTEGWILLARRTSSRYNRTGQIEDLETAILALESVLPRLSPGDHVWRRLVQQRLGQDLRLIFQKNADVADIRAAYRHLMKAIRAPLLDEFEKVNLFVELCQVLICRHGATANKDAFNRGVEILESLVPFVRHKKGLCMANLGLLYSYLASAENLWVQDAISKTEKAVASIGVTDPVRAGLLYNLGMLLLERRRWEQADGGAGLGCMVQCCQRPTGSPLARVLSARKAVELLILDGHLERAREVAQMVLHLLPYAFSRDLERQHQQRSLREFKDFASDTCSMLLKQGYADEALITIVFVRDITNPYILDCQRNLPDLSQSHPELAEEYETKQELFAQTAHGGDIGISVRGRRTALHQLQECEERIRQQAGFEDFLRRRTIPELMDCARDGPIVIVNWSHISCEAILIMSCGIDTVPLPDMMSEAPPESKRHLTRNANIGSDAEDADPNYDESDREDDISSLTKELSWLWGTCVHPILETLASHDAISTTGDRSRVWWMGTGAASGLPFHAAGEDDEDSCLHQVISSYVPSIKALQNARARAAEQLERNHRSSVLEIMMVERSEDCWAGGMNHDEQDLLRAEIAVIVRDMGNIRMENPQFRLTSGGVVRFVCTGHPDPQDPAHDYFLLERETESGSVTDGITISTILNRKPTHYRSICSPPEIVYQSINSPTKGLMDELRSTCPAHVVDSMWPCTDDTYNEIQEYFAISDPTRGVAEAVRDALLETRDEFGPKCPAWVTFTHTGA